MRAFIRHPSGVPLEIGSGGRVTHALRRLQNISIGGVCVETDQFMETGLIVTVKIPSVQPPFEANGRVVWCLKKNAAFDVGIQFLNEKDLFAARMVEQVCHIEHYRNEVLRQEGRQLSSQEAAEEWVAKYAPLFPDIGGKGT